MYNTKVLISKREVIAPIIDYMMPVDFCQKNKLIINFTTNDMTSKFQLFSKKKTNALYLNEVIWT